MSERFLRIGALWFFGCVLLGVYMGITHQFADRPIHVHGNLLGWVSCALFALVHRAWPALARSSLANVHFWLHNLGLPVLLLGLALAARGVSVAEPLLGIGSVMLTLATASFGWLVWRGTREPARGLAQSAAVCS
jgi:hypothetical protein